MAEYSIGLDFGTLSVRAVLVDARSGREVCTSVFSYPHGVLSDRLPGGKELPPFWALQHPQDYLDGLSYTVREVLRKSGVSAESVIGLGLDFTSSTFLPVDRDYVPLCLKEGFRNEPHAWVKLWKHHVTQKYAQRMTEAAVSRGEPFLKHYDGRVSAEWMLPRVLETLEEAPEVCRAAYRFMEAGDWIVHCLTGAECASLNMAGFKALWTKENGYPSEEYTAALHPQFPDIIRNKLSHDLRPLGAKAGALSRYGAELTGLTEKTAVAVACIDAQASVPLVGRPQAGKMIMCIGTSTGHIMLSEEFHQVPGMTGCVCDGIVPGMVAYESGQICVGDSLNWFVDNCVPDVYKKAADDAGMNIHDYLTGKASELSPGESGLLALDWWNGNRSVLCDYDLSGLLIGLTLSTKPEEVYRALIESTAFGTRRIMESYEECGIEIVELYACGGIAKKNALFMQIYSDVLGRTIRIVPTEQGPALGSAIFGSVAAGEKAGGYDSVFEACAEMSQAPEKSYTPLPEHVESYELLYSEYLRLHDYFGRGENNVMKKLKQMKQSFR